MTMTNTLSSRQAANKRRGVTLVELAIALGVMGFVTAAIWGTASVVRSRQPIHDTVQLVSEIAGNVRGVYTGFSAVAVPPAAIAGQIAAGLYPAGVLNAAGNNTVNAWNGTILIHFNTAPRFDGFSIEFTLPITIPASERREVCAAMATRLPGTATNYAGGLAGPLPAAAPNIDANQGGGPALTLLNNGAWKNVTGITAISGASASSFFGAGANENCTGFAVYYRL